MPPKKRKPLWNKRKGSKAEDLDAKFEEKWEHAMAMQAENNVEAANKAFEEVIFVPCAWRRG